jgi:hypothetical protein
MVLDTILYRLHHIDELFFKHGIEAMSNPDVFKKKQLFLLLQERMIASKQVLAKYSEEGFIYPDSSLTEREIRFFDLFWVFLEDYLNKSKYWEYPLSVLNLYKIQREHFIVTDHNYQNVLTSIYNTLFKHMKSHEMLVSLLELPFYLINYGLLFLYLIKIIVSPPIAVEVAKYNFYCTLHTFFFFSKQVFYYNYSVLRTGYALFSLFQTFYLLIKNLK